MKKKIAYVIQATRLVLEKSLYRVAFVVTAIFFFGLFIYIPVWTTPGNDLKFQLSIFTPQDYIILTVLSALTSLSIISNIFVIKRQFTRKEGATLALQGGGGGLSAVVASIFGTASCSTCVGSLFGFLGFGGILFLLQYRAPIAIGVIVLMLASLYFTSKRVLGVCNLKKN